MNQPVSDFRREIDFRFVSETEAIVPFRLHAPVNGRDNAIHPRKPKPVPFPDERLSFCRAIGNPGPLTLELGFNQHDSVLRVNGKSIPDVASGDGVEKSQKKGVSRSHDPQGKDLVPCGQKQDG